MTDSVSALQAAFDAAFARPPAVPDGDREDLLLVRAGDRRLALRVLDAALIAASPVLTQVPSANPALLGVAGSRGAVVAVYSLAQLVGARPAATRHGGFIATCAGDRTAALFFDELIGYHTVRSGDIRRAEGSVDIIEIVGEQVTVVRMETLLKRIGSRALAAAGTE